MSRPSSRCGMTLIEALISIAVVALVLPIAIAGVSRAVQSAEQVRRMDIARRLAETRLSLLSADGSWQSSATSGDFDPRVDGDDATGFHWQLTVTPWRDPVVRTLSLTVSWNNSQRTVTMETMATPPPTP